MSRKTDSLGQARFTYQESKSGIVQIAFHGKLVTTLAGNAADRFLSRIANLEPRAQQLLMAKATGHFKHGNERPTKSK